MSVNPVCRAASYTVYNLGVTILIGLIRTIVAIAYIAKHAFYATAYDQAIQVQAQSRQNQFAQNQEKRDQNLERAKQATKNSTDVGELLMNFGGQVLTAAGNAAGQVFDNAVYDVKELLENASNESVQAAQKTRQELWYGELRRGLAELFVVGAPYYTYRDNFSERTVSVFGLKELAEHIQFEQTTDLMIQSLIGKRHYNPLF